MLLEHLAEPIPDTPRSTTATISGSRSLKPPVAHGRVAVRINRIVECECRYFAIEILTNDGRQLLPVLAVHRWFAGTVPGYLAL